jgi:hypothetical protein
MVQRALYTVLMGNYEKLNPLPEIAQQGIDAFCFTDDATLRSTTWTIVPVEPAFAVDSVRSQRLIKILGHPSLNSFDETLFIDSTVHLKVNPNDILDSWLAEADLALPEHSFRSSVEEEFAEVIVGMLDSRERVTEQRDHYRQLYAETLASRPLWTAMMARRRAPAVDEFSRVWAEHVLRYSRRDQLSVSVAAKVSGVALTRIPLDNHESDLHQWPIRSGLRSDVRRTDMPDYFAMNEYNQRQAEHYQQQLEQTWKTLSWRITKPLRIKRRRTGS